MEQNSDCWYYSVCNRARNSCKTACIRYLEMQSLMDTSGIPKKRQYPQKLIAPKEDLKAFNTLNDIKNNITEFIDNGKSLFICSNTTGNGKTSWAIKLVLKYFDSIWAGNGFNPRALFINVPTFLIKCKDFDNKDSEFEELKKLIPTVDLVVWDDIASTGISAYDYSQLLMYLDVRCSNGLSNIYTSNLTNIDDLGNLIGEKLASRIFSNDTTVVEFKGGDRR